MLLKDFSDYGNAGARASPNNAVLLDVAPLSVAMETFTPGERFFTIENHELAHVATMDVWNSQRRILAPLPPRQAHAGQEHPESILYNFLATPRVNVPRWYLEGSAVFFETWMSGGLGRAQGGYDEMVFRAKVRDHDNFFSPLGLESEGIAVDFQVGVNDYLYGTRFFSYLALTYGPEKAVEWLRRREGSKAFLRRSVQACVRPASSTRSGTTGSPSSTDYQNANLAKLAQYPLTADGEAQPARASARCRAASSTPKTNSLDRRLPLSRHDRVHRPHGSRHRQADQAPRDQGHDALQGDERGLRSRRPHRLLYRGQLRVPRPCSRSMSTPAKAHAAQGRAHRRHGGQPSGQVDLGYPPRKRPCDDRPHSAALRRLQPGPHLQIRPDPVRPRHLARRQIAVRLVRRDQRHADDARVEARRTVAGRASRSRSRGSRCRPRRPKASSSRQTARRCTARPIIPASRTSSASISPPRSSTPSATPRPASSIRSRSPTVRSSPTNIAARDFSRCAFKPKVQQDLGTIEFLGTKVVNDASRAQELGRWLTGQGRPRQHDHRAQQVQQRAAVEARRHVSDRRGLQRRRFARLLLPLRRPARIQPDQRELQHLALQSI